jgi:hypothetical protein
MENKHEPKQVQKKLKEAFDAWFHHVEYWHNSDVCKHFWIQHSVFDRKDKPGSLCGEFGEWFINCIVPGTTNQSIFDVHDLKYSDNETNVQFHSGNYKHTDFSLDEILNPRGQSTPTRIYLMDLYPEMKPRHFHGRCTTQTEHVFVWEETCQKFVCQKLK